MTPTPAPDGAVAPVAAARPAPRSAPDDGLDLLVQDTPMPDVEALVERTHALLADHVPLSLLLDLAAGPHSDELLAAEPADDAWLHLPEQR